MRHQTTNYDPTPAAGETQAPRQERAIRPRITLTDRHTIMLVREFEDKYPGLSAPRIVSIIVQDYKTRLGTTLPG